MTAQTAGELGLRETGSPETDRLLLRRTKTRRPGGPGSLVVVRHTDPLLRHGQLADPAQAAADARVGAVIELLDRLMVSGTAGGPAARAAVRAAGERVSSEVLEEAVRLRKEGASI